MKTVRLFTRILPLALAALLSVPLAAAPPPPAWETVDSAVTDRQDDFVVTVKDFYIYVTVPQPTGVKLFTILGQQIAQANLPAGTSRYRVSARGIYILKVGPVTKRITI